MRQIVRPAIRLPTLEAIDVQYGEDWKRTGLGAPPDKRWGTADIRGALYAMHGRACAYCQQYLPENDRGDVEHFRPRQIYPWLAYTFGNYLLSCSTCNGLKLARFPLRPGSRPVDYVQRARLDSEERLLLDPAIDPTESWIGYDIFKDRCPAEPLANLSAQEQEKITKTIEIFRLNMRPDLVRDRPAKFDEIQTLLAALDSGKHDSVGKLKKLASRYSAHGLVARKILARARPSLLPTPHEEVEFLVDDLCIDFSVIDGSQDQHWKNKRDQILFALAILWHSPPAATADTVGAWLTQRKMDDIVRPYVNKINLLPVDSR